MMSTRCRARSTRLTWSGLSSPAACAAARIGERAGSSSANRDLFGPTVAAARTRRAASPGEIRSNWVTSFGTVATQCFSASPARSIWPTIRWSTLDIRFRNVSNRCVTTTRVSGSSSSRSTAAASAVRFSSSRSIRAGTGPGSGSVLEVSAMHPILSERVFECNRWSSREVNKTRGLSGSRVRSRPLGLVRM